MNFNIGFYSSFFCAPFSNWNNLDNWDFFIINIVSHNYARSDFSSF